MPRRPVLCLGVAVALFTAKILCFVQTAKFQPKRPDRRHHVCMSANELVNMAQMMLGVTTCDENVTKVLWLSKRQRWRRGWLSRRWRWWTVQRSDTLQYKYLSVSSRFWLEQLFSDFQKFAQSRFSWKAERSMTKINKLLVNNDTVWQQFVANESLSLTPPVNESFPSLPDAILYGALSEHVHQPPWLTVLNLTDPPYSEHVYLLRDLGVHYSKKLNFFLVCGSEPGTRWPDEARSRYTLKKRRRVLVIPDFTWEPWRLQWTMG